MAFLRKAGSILRQTAGNHINSKICGVNPSVFQMLRCMSTSKVFVGGLSYSTDETSLREAFNNYGEVIEARVITDRETGRSRGFGFITFTSGEEASAAIQALDGQDLHGRRVRVNYANDRQKGFGGGGGYGGSGGYGGGGGYGGNYGGGGGYGTGGGGGYGDNYRSGGGGGDGGGYGANSYDSGAGNYAQGDGNYSQGTNFNSGSVGDFGSANQSYGVAGGDGGSDNYVSGDAGANSSIGTSGFDGSTGLGQSGDQFGSNENNGANLSGGLGQDGLIEGNYRDDDDESDFAKRA